MSLANRLLGNWQKHPFVIIEEAHLNLQHASLAVLCDVLHDELYSVSNPESVGVIVLSPGQIEAGTGYELMVLGKTIDDACRTAKNIETKIKSVFV